MTEATDAAAATIRVAVGLHSPVSTTGDIWDFWSAGAWVVIPTNVEVRADGTAVMGAGLAEQAADRFDGLSARYGVALNAGTTRLAVASSRVLLVPTKKRWRDPSSLAMVREAVHGIATWSARHPGEVVVVPPLGAGLGGLLWRDVAPILQTGLACLPVVILEPVADLAGAASPARALAAKSSPS